ncbi:MAG: DEAD/DEAH box helicase [Acidimicrobiia bacterium]|nr:DEAD/DEAH box helicase [Acidimicrobiia bacterium]
MTTTFSDLGLPSSLDRALTEAGITTPFPIQAMALPDALAGRDVTGKAKTGSGKTLAFGLPILARGERGRPRTPAALVLAPARELALQIASDLEPLADAVDRTVAVVYGGASMDAQIDAVRNGADIVVATPGRLIDLIQRDEVVLDGIGMVAIDEADRMADLGFLPQVEWLLRHVPDNAQMMLFSATLDGAVAALVRHMDDPVVHSVEEVNLTVDEMVHRFLKVHRMDRARVINAIAEANGRVIVFCRTKRTCDRLAGELVELGVPAAALHGDLAQSQRERALRRFTENDRSVLVATDVAARGIHVNEVDVVIHADPPEDHKAYLHRSGRTARAGAEGLVVSLIEWDQELAVRRLQRVLRLDDIPQVEMFSNDERLSDLVGWDPRTSVPA